MYNVLQAFARRQHLQAFATVTRLGGITQPYTHIHASIHIQIHAHIQAYINTYKHTYTDICKHTLSSY